MAPASLNQGDAVHYRESDAVTHYLRTIAVHLDQTGCEDVADCALNWALRVSAPLVAV